MKKLFLGIYFLFRVVISNAQEQSFSEDEFEKIIQDIVPSETSEEQQGEMYDMLYQWYTTPLNLNKASREDLEALQLLSKADIEAFLNYKQKYGNLVSIYELQAIPEWNLSVIRKLLPFVIIEEAFDGRKFLDRIKKNSNHFLTIRTDRVLQKRKGYIPNAQNETMYKGSPYKYLIRYRNSLSKDYSIGLTMEKDAGEQLVWSPEQKTYLMDYISFHAAVFNKGKFKSILLGDYKLQFGQGLVLGGGFFIGKSAESILSVKRNSRGILPYNSVMESGFFRGGAITYSVLKNIDLTCFYSGNAMDSKITIDNTVGSISNYGMHRTNSELNSKKSFQEKAFGGNINYHRKTVKTGFTFVHTFYSHPIQEADRIYNRFDFSGKENTVASIDFSKVIQNITIFGEGAVSSNQAKALVVGGITSLSSKLDFAFLHRNYEKNFHSFYANAFSEGTGAANEKGYYWGLRFKLSGKWTWSAYYDYFIFPWMRFMKDSPTKGYGYLGRLQFTPSKKILLYYQLRCEEAEKNQSDNTTNIDFAVPSVKYNSIINIDSKFGQLFLRSRVQWSSYRQSNAATKGFVIAQDINVDFRTIKFSTRFALFDTDDYDNRQYVYEKDVLYSVSFPAYYGKGIRTYWIVQWKVTKKMDFWIRYSNTTYTDRETISSGWEEVKGNKISEIRLQLRYRL